MARRIRRRFSLIEQLAAVASNALLDGKERRGVTRAAQRADIGLGEMLVFSLQCFRKLRVLDEALRAHALEAERLLPRGTPTGVDRRHGDVVEALRPPRADVENTRQLGMVQKMQIDLGDVLDRDEVAALLSVPVSPRPGEGTHAPLRRI